MFSEKTKDKYTKIDKSNSDQYSSKIKELKIIHQNIQSIRNKSLELNIFINEEKPDIICLTEHSLKKEEMQECTIEGYRVVDNYCRSLSRGGGVLISAKNGLQVTKIKKVTGKIKQLEKHFEYAIVQVGKERKINVITIYRAPSGNLNTFFEKLTQLMNIIEYKKRKHDIVICGDFNINILNTRSAGYSQLNTFIKEHNLTITVKEITRETSKSATTIDNILTNIKKRQYKVNVINSAISDHYAQKIEITTESDYKEKGRDDMEYRCVESRNIENNIGYLKILLKRQDWREVYTANNVNEKYNAFTSRFIHLFNVACPKKIVRVNKNKKQNWVTIGILTARRKLRLYNKIGKNITNQETLTYLRNYKKMYKKVIRAAKAKEIERNINNSSNKAKALWRSINSERGSRNKDKEKEVKQL
ncbi:MAG: endonuclease/exonuclease/phosphatase family protein, partial [Wolbachia pipientis]